MTNVSVVPLVMVAQPVNKERNSAKIIERMDILLSCGANTGKAPSLLHHHAEAKTFPPIRRVR